LILVELEAKKRAVLEISCGRKKRERDPAKERASVGARIKKN